LLSSLCRLAFDVITLNLIPTKRMPRKPALLFTAKISLSALLLWLVLSRIDAPNIMVRIRAVNPLWIIPMFVVAPLSILLSAWRWKILALGLLGYWEAVRYTWIGLFFGSILPGIVGGDLAKGLSLAAKTPTARDVRLPISIVVDKVVGFWAMLLMFDFVALGLLVTMPQLLNGFRNVLWLTLAGTGLGVGGAVTLCHPKVAQACEFLVNRLPFSFFQALAKRLIDALGSYRGRGMTLLGAAGISTGIHLLNAGIYWLVLRSLSVPASFSFAAVFYILLSVLLSIPVSISGIGVRDVFAASIFSAFGLKPEAGVAFSWLLLALSIPNIAVGGLIQMWEMLKRRHTH